MAVIAIDGVAGSGKSTLARSLARELGYSYLDTGAMYRALSLAALREGLDWDSAMAITDLAQRYDVYVDEHPPSAAGEPTRVLLDGEDVSREIREPEVSKGSSAIAVHPGVRSELVRRQKEWIAEHPDCVVEGRDIGSVVAPNAQVKIYLTADSEQRVERRVSESSFKTDELHEHLAWRDKNDMTKGGLQQVDEAAVIDTTDLQPEETLKIALDLVKAKS